jgi:hypothetical protein
MVGFADESTGQVNDFTANPQPSPEVLNKFMQHDAQLWSDLLWLSGGLLELPKCYFHHLHFTFEADGRPIVMGGQVGPSLVLSGNQDRPFSIPHRNQPLHLIKALGIGKHQPVTAPSIFKSYARNLMQWHPNY